MPRSSRLAEEIGAEIQVSLPRLARQVSRDLNRHRHVAKAIEDAGFIKEVQFRDLDREWRCAGLAGKRQSIGSGYHELVGVSVISQPTIVSENAMRFEEEDSSFRILLLTPPAKSHRMQWNQYSEVYHLLRRQALASYDLLLLDIPLCLSRGIETSSEAAEVKKDWAGFIQAYHELSQCISECYPHKKDAPILVSVRDSVRRGLPNEIGASVDLDGTNDSLLVSIMLTAGRRTSHHNVDRTLRYDLGDNGIPEREFSFFYVRLNKGNNILQVEMPGSKNDWNDALIDRLCSMLKRLALDGLGKGIPVPLWLAKRKSRFSGKVLQYAFSRIKDDGRGREE